MNWDYIAGTFTCPSCRLLGQYPQCQRRSGTTNQAIQILKQGLLTQYGINLGDMTSYVAPGNGITVNRIKLYRVRQLNMWRRIWRNQSIRTGTSSPMVKGRLRNKPPSPARNADALKTHDQSSGNSSEANAILK